MLTFFVSSFTTLFYIHFYFEAAQSCLEVRRIQTKKKDYKHPIQSIAPVGMKDEVR